MFLGFRCIDHMTSVLLQDIQSLTFMQKTADQTMGLGQCLMSSPGQDIHTDIHSLCLEFSFKESILHIIYKLNKKSNKGPLLPPKEGNHLQSNNQRQEQHRAHISLQMPQPRAFLPWLPLYPGVTESCGKGRTGL